MIDFLMENPNITAIDESIKQWNDNNKIKHYIELFLNWLRIKNPKEIILRKQIIFFLLNNNSSDDHYELYSLDI